MYNITVIEDHELMVDPGITLTIGAGSTFKLMTSGAPTYIGVYGTLEVNGMPGNEVIFTSLQNLTVGEEKCHSAPAIKFSSSF